MSLLYSLKGVASAARRRPSECANRPAWPGARPLRVLCSHSACELSCRMATPQCKHLFCGSCLYSRSAADKSCRAHFAYTNSYRVVLAFDASLSDTVAVRTQAACDAKRFASSGTQRSVHALEIALHQGSALLTEPSRCCRTQRAVMQSPLLHGKQFLGDTAQLGRGNGSKTQALFKGGTKQLKKSAPSKSGQKASNVITKFAQKNKPKGTNKKTPVAPSGGKRSQRGGGGRGGNYQGIGTLGTCEPSSGRLALVITAVMAACSHTMLTPTTLSLLNNTYESSNLLGAQGAVCTQLMSSGCLTLTDQSGWTVPCREIEGELPSTKLCSDQSAG